MRAARVISNLAQNNVGINENGSDGYSNSGGLCSNCDVMSEMEMLIAIVTLTKTIVAIKMVVKTTTKEGN